MVSHTSRCFWRPLRMSMPRFNRYCYVYGCRVDTQNDRKYCVCMSASGTEETKTKEANEWCNPFANCFVSLGCGQRADEKDISFSSPSYPSRRRHSNTGSPTCGIQGHSWPVATIPPSRGKMIWRHRDVLLFEKRHFHKGVAMKQAWKCCRTFVCQYSYESSEHMVILFIPHPRISLQASQTKRLSL